VDEHAARVQALEAERLRPVRRPDPGACMSGPTAQLQRARLVADMEALERAQAAAWEARKQAAAAAQRARYARARRLAADDEGRATG
jgi:hypothetical protein